MGESEAISGHRCSQERSLLVVARRHDWDPAQRRAAWELDQSAPDWTVFYGPYTRRFYAIAAQPIHSPLVLDAHDVAELRRQIHEAETTDFQPGPRKEHPSLTALNSTARLPSESVRRDILDEQE